MTPHILPDGSHLTQLETAAVLKDSGLSPLGPVAVNTMAPDEGNTFLLGKVATAAQKQRFLAPLVSGEARSAFFMTSRRRKAALAPILRCYRPRRSKTAISGGIRGRRKFITGAEGAPGRHPDGANR